MYAKIQQEVQETYPDLHFSKRGREVFLTGFYPLVEGERVYDRYLIEVEVSKDSAAGLPIVKEIGGRIPRDPNRHMESDGKACVVLPDAFWYEHPDGMSLLDFLNGPVRGFFAGQSLMELGEPDPWPTGEWGHGAEGIIDFYTKVVGSDDPQIVLAHLDVLKRKEVKGHWPCPCGSGEKLRKCHLSFITELRSRIPRDVAAKSGEKLLEGFPKLGPISSKVGK